MTNPPYLNRLHGLDTLRAIAISIVLIYHYRVVVSNEPLFGFMSNLGWTGVDLFFVLSGYLIGNQIFSRLAKNQGFSLSQFYFRRALRTLPNYYAVLIAYLLLPDILGGSNTAPIWAFLTFTQNLKMLPGETFTHSWSLCIEEQFYLLFPLAALLALKFKKSVTVGWSLLLLGVCIAIFLRGYHWYTQGQAEMTGLRFMEYIYYSSFTRFDELLPGLAIAMLKNFHPVTHQKLSRYGNHFLVAGCIATVLVFYMFKNYLYIPNYGYSFLTLSFGYTLLAMSFALLVYAALCENSWLYQCRIPGAMTLALWSYAIYLVHKPLFLVLKNNLTELGVDTNTYFGLTIIFTLSVVTGWLLYRLVERPFLNLRDRATFPLTTLTHSKLAEPKIP